jgi:translation initiation factor eIF-2B subunit delta
MMAKEHRIPVVACVETYKFGERVLLDGIASNELSGEDLFQLPEAGSGTRIKEDSRNGITALPLLCDLTPPSCITAVCTEVSCSRKVGEDGTDVRSGSSLLVQCPLCWVKDTCSDCPTSLLSFPSRPERPASRSITAMHHVLQSPPYSRCIYTISSSR